MHRVRMMYGNGLRREIWEDLMNRFGIAKIGELYASTEGNTSLGTYDQFKKPYNLQNTRYEFRSEHWQQGGRLWLLPHLPVCPPTLSRGAGQGERGDGRGGPGPGRHVPALQTRRTWRNGGQDHQGQSGQGVQRLPVAQGDEQETAAQRI